MLVSLYIRNFGPIGDEPFVFSMETQHKGETNKNKEYIFETGFPEHPYLMKSAGIFGPNASGKSTIFKTIRILKFLINTSHKFDGNDLLPDEVFKLSNLKDDYSEIEIRFIQSDTMYEYGVVFNKNQIKKEMFRKKNKGKGKRWVVIIDREKNILHTDLMPFLDNISGLLDDKPLSDLHSLATRIFWSGLQENQLALSEIMHKKECDYFDTFLRFFHKVKIFQGDEIPWTYGMGEFDDKKQQIITLLNEADFGVTNIELVTEDILADGISDKKAPNFVKNLLRNKELQKDLEEQNSKVFIPLTGGRMLKITKEKVEIQTVYFTIKNSETEDTFPLSEMSSGTRSFFAYANMLDNVLEQGTIVLIDEIERSLHPYLTNYIVNLFNDKDTNPKNAQLVFISHDVSLLNKRTLKPEQVYFTNKNSETLQSELYSLSEFTLKNDRDDDYSKKYLQGVFGAIPYIT